MFVTYISHSQLTAGLNPRCQTCKEEIKQACYWGNVQIPHMMIADVSQEIKCPKRMCKKNMKPRWEDKRLLIFKCGLYYITDRAEKYHSVRFQRWRTSESMQIYIRVKPELKRFFEDALEPRSPQVIMMTDHRCRNLRYTSSILDDSLRQERIHPVDMWILFMPRVNVVHSRCALPNPLRLALKCHHSPPTHCSHFSPVLRFHSFFSLSILTNSIAAC